MPSFLTKTFSTFWKRILQIDQSSNAGVDSTTRALQTGDGVNTVVSLSDDQLIVQPQNDDTETSLLVKTQSGSQVFAVDTRNLRVAVGSSRVNATTQYKEMGLYDFVPGGAGYHYPLISQNMFKAGGAEELTFDNDWGNGADPATTLNVSNLTDIENAIAVYWRLQDAITIDTIKGFITATGSITYTIHLFSYAIDLTTNFGDLSDGTLIAHSTTTPADVSSIKPVSMTIDSADVASARVIVGFVENVTDTSRISVQLTTKYHIQ